VEDIELGGGPLVTVMQKGGRKMEERWLGKVKNWIHTSKKIRNRSEGIEKEPISNVLGVSS